MSEYKRLTKSGGKYASSVYSLDLQKYVYGDDIVENQNEGLAQQVIERLADLEDKIEQGTLFKLPCKVGDIVYEIFYSKYEARVLEMKVIQIVMQETINYLCKTTSRCLYNYGWVKNEDFGKTVFLTRAEAEARLKELQ